jgi:hypothetical protein
MHVHIPGLPIQIVPLHVLPLCPHEANRWSCMTQSRAQSSAVPATQQSGGCTVHDPAQSPSYGPILYSLIRLLSSRHLNDASHRGTYELAHSTILAIFAALWQLGSTTSTEDQATRVERPTFVEKIVPLYMQCLLEVRPTVMLYFPSVVENVQYIQNSVDGKLTTPAAPHV